MSNIYEGILRFKGTWRDYQARVLKNFDNYLNDDKVHIVAAPGSGKTTIGIEFIRKLGKPCLILSPSITIREQWKDRIEEGFLEEGIEGKKWISGDIKNPKAITTITYQALHSCTIRYSGDLIESEVETDNGEEAVDTSEMGDIDMTLATVETVDFMGFDLYKTIQEAGIGVLCLDEAHHLRNEWWKALEELIAKVKGLKVVSLTATPPYDSTPGQWERYINLCGEIDEEITVPELIKEGSLCPHQDFVYFNYPTAQENKAVVEWKKKVSVVIDTAMADREFEHMIMTHPGINAPKDYSEKFLDDPAYLSALLVYMNEKEIEYPKALKTLIGTNAKIPKMEPKWMEKLLQGFLYGDIDSYNCSTEYRQQWIHTLKSENLIVRNQVSMVNNQNINKMLISSRGKIESIREITLAESSNMGSKLRQLILCDYIKKEFLSKIGDSSAMVDTIGVIPVFELLRRENIPGQKLGVLSGSVILIPAEAQEYLDELFKQNNMSANYKQIKDLQYVSVDIVGDGHMKTALITQLFDAGYITILIGTKSLLGEGWDSPCINTLILATFVGSFMLSNQMRGRAIRTYHADPDKTGNIWHLVSVTDEGSEDFEMVKRRMNGFLGVHYTEKSIEGGIERLSIIKQPFTKKSVKKMNEEMLKISTKRATLKQRWMEAMDNTAKLEVEVMSEIGEEPLKSGFFMLNVWSIVIVSTIISVLGILLQISFLSANFGMGYSVILMILILVALVLIAKYGYRLFSFMTPQKRMKHIAKAILHTLQLKGLITSTDVLPKAEVNQDILIVSYLKGGTMREKDVFATAVYDSFDALDNQRYILISKKKKRLHYEYFAVPSVFSQKKEDAIAFGIAISALMGQYDIVYTRNPEGRKRLLEGRIYAFSNQCDRMCTKKKKVKSDFE